MVLPGEILDFKIKPTYITTYAYIYNNSWDLWKSAPENNVFLTSKRKVIPPPHGIEVSINKELSLML